MKTTTIITRRSFLAKSTAAGIGATFIAQPFQIFGQGAPNRKITVAIMGIRSRGNQLAKVFAAQKDCEVAYLCDVDDRYFEKALKGVGEYQKKTPKAEKDIRKILEDKSIDAIAIAAPDHWHAPAAIMALQAGKHVYVEKPCSHNPREGELLVAAKEKYNRVVQMGNQRRSWPNVMQAITDIKEGLIGKVYYAKGWYANTRAPIGYGKAAPVPDYLDFDLWQGPAPRKPYMDNIHPYNWHWFWHWGTGESLNNGTHEVDLMRWGLGVDYPTRVVSSGGRYHYQDDWETPDTHIMSYDFEGGISMNWEGRSCNGMSSEGGGRGVVFYGEKGSLVMPGGNAYTVYDNKSGKKNIIKEVKDDPNPTDKINAVGPGMRLDMDHVTDFLDAIRESKVPRSNIHEGHKSVLLCQLGNIAQRTGRVLNIDQRNGQIIGDPEAMKLWSREYEPGWEVKI